jgi:hypothetical protein
MKHLLTSVVLASAMFSAGAMAQSAKFAASWENGDTNPVTATSADSCTLGVCTNNPDETNVEIMLAEMKVPEGKEIFVGVSSEIMIHLVTEAKGGRKTDGTFFSSTAMAQGDVDVTLTLINSKGETCGIAPDNQVTLKSEMRLLTVSAGGTAAILDEEFWIEVGITTESKGAHHFEFLGVDCPGGDYQLTATFDLTAITAASGEDSNALATVTLFDRMITMQEVRAVKGSIVDPDA